MTKGGNTPTYPDNGMVHIVTFVLALFLGDGYGWWSATIFARGMEGAILPLNIFAIALCIVLLVTGRAFGKPPDDGTLRKGLIHDFYAGVWLHPRVAGIDLKLLINSRISMTMWFIHSLSSIVLICRSGVIDWGVIGCAASQMLYLSSFFAQEPHYVHTIDIIEDRAGFYETWGCLVWVPSVYTLHTRVGLIYGSGLDQRRAICVFAVGAVAWVCNVWANEQRRRFRQSPRSPICCSASPPKQIQATYQVYDTESEEMVTRTNPLLVDGWWGAMRHPQYIFDIVQSFTWGILGGGLTRNGLAMFYPIYITVLLLHRCIRDERRCSEKYGEAYEEYCSIVRYRVIPGVW
jgi:7-dehydrocholesterol reductase